jgi:Nuclease-related domain
MSSRSPRQTSRTDGGSPGGSEVREYERRRARRKERARVRLGPLGQVLTRLIGDPHSTRAWKQGADAEIRVARQLAKHLNGRDVVLLHDRRIPGRGRKNIDHIAVGPGGITVIETKSTRGRLRTEKRAGFLSPRREVLLINGRDRTHLVDGLEHQIEAVRTVIAELGVEELDVRGALCFPNLDRLPQLRQLTIHSGTIAIHAPRGVAKLARR